MKVNGIQKPNILIDLVKDNNHAGHKVAIFSNKNDTVNFVSYHLDENQIDHIKICKDVDYQNRIGLLDDFNRGNINVLCCSDVISRGIDTKNLHHVINYDCPRHMSDYVHRAGRTGRVGNNFCGLVTTLVHKEPEARLVQEIEMAVRTNTKLQGINPNIKRLITKLKHSQGAEETPINYNMFDSQ